VGLHEASVAEFLSETLEVDWHAATLRSVALGALHAVSLCIHVIGRASAQARDGDPTHAVNQVDRLWSSQSEVVWLFSRAWARFVAGSRPEAIVAVDGMDVDADGHATIAAYLVTSHARATPLPWNTVEKATLEGRRNRHEDELLGEFAACLPEGKRVTILADRGFGDQARHTQPRSLGMDW
jgi:hypothetical protein